MNRALAAGAAGMSAQQAVLDVVSRNLANIDTPGYRAARPEFAAFMAPDGSALPSASASARLLFTPGRLESTDDEHDIAIDGPGFFAVLADDHRIAYTRAGDFTPDARGRLRLPCGAALEGVTIPPATTALDVAPDGSVHAHVAGDTKPRLAGRIMLHAFASEAGLRLGDDGLFYATAASGSPSTGRPSHGGFGSLRQRCLERANVGVVDEMMSILTAQRAYEANAKIVQAGDEMLRLANNLERG